MLVKSLGLAIQFADFQYVEVYVFKLQNRCVRWMRNRDRCTIIMIIIMIYDYIISSYYIVSCFFCQCNVVKLSFVLEKFLFFFSDVVMMSRVSLHRYRFQIQ